MNEKDVWDVIHYMESVVGKDGLGGMTKKELQKLVTDVYVKLNEIV